MFKKMIVLCLVVMYMVSNVNITKAKAEQVCGAEEYQKIINGVDELYGESGIMEYSFDSIVSKPGDKEFRILIKYKYNFTTGIHTGVASYSTGKKVDAKFNFTYNSNTGKIKYKGIIKKDIMILDYLEDIVYDRIKVNNAIDVASVVVDVLAADDSNIAEKTKKGIKGTTVNQLGIKIKFNINTGSEYKEIKYSSVNTKGDVTEKLKSAIKKIG